MRINIFPIAATAAISCSSAFSATIYSWGGNEYGQSTPPLSQAQAVAAGFVTSLALQPDGTVAVWGNNDFSQHLVPVHVNNVVAIVSVITVAWR